MLTRSAERSRSTRYLLHHDVLTDSSAAPTQSDRTRAPSNRRVTLLLESATDSSLRLVSVPPLGHAANPFAHLTCSRHRCGSQSIHFLFDPAA